MKTLFVFCVDNVIDLITNSSSELFVLRGESLRGVEDMIRSVYPDYEREYHSVVNIADATPEQLDQYISYEYNGWSNEEQRMLQDVLQGFTFEEMYETHVSTYTGHDGTKRTSSYTYTRDVREDNRERYVNAISPKRDMFFLFSKDENPNWDMQERLMNVGIRYHLG